MQPFPSTSSPVLVVPAAEPPLPAGAPLESIALELPARETRYLGLAMNWLVAFCVFSIVGGLAAKRWIKVEI